ncbi:hypothetical protein BDQ17DRAFT_1434886 [Cyathus striatus]|nr:hypothetical protein BDQ17DRAFT_1434886 [Cyathus striatus]
MASFTAISDAAKSTEELINEVYALRRQVVTLTEALRSQTALTTAANSHCTIMGRVNGELRTRLENSHKKTNRGGSTKVKGRFLTHPELMAAHKKEYEEHVTKKKATEEKRRQKDHRSEEMEACIRCDGVSKTFELPLSLYKRKNELRTIARALGLAEDGKMTVISLTASIRAHLTENELILQKDPAFQVYFQINGVV